MELGIIPLISNTSRFVDRDMYMRYRGCGVGHLEPLTRAQYDRTQTHTLLEEEEDVQDDYLPVILENEGSGQADGLGSDDDDEDSASDSSKDSEEDDDSESDPSSNHETDDETDSGSEEGSVNARYDI